MKGILRTVEDRIFLVKTEDGRYNTLDLREKPEKSGLSPMETMLFAAAGCSAIDVLVILTKKRYEVRELIMEIEGRRREEHPKIWEYIKYRYIVRGRGIKPEDVEKAIQLSLNKYCSATITLVRAGAKLEWEYRVEEE